MTNSREKFLLLVKDVRHNFEYIFNNTPLFKEDLQQAFDNCFVNLQATHKHLTSKTYDTYCECFETVDLLHKGWIWNTVEAKTRVCYVIRAIKVLEKIVTLNKCSTTKQLRLAKTGENDWRIELTTELKNRLIQPNLGLKRMCV